MSRHWQNVWKQREKANKVKGIIKQVSLVALVYFIECFIYIINDRMPPNELVLTTLVVVVLVTDSEFP